MSLFTGLSAFPLTPLADDQLDEVAFTGLVERLATSSLDSITVLGSTGSYAYLTAEERARVAQLAVAHAGSTPVHVGVGALRTSQVLANIASAERAGAAGLLVAPMTYQPLTDQDVYELFRTVTQHTELPVIVYDNPGTTHFTFGPMAAAGLIAGCDTWYSVLAGTIPQPALTIMQAIQDHRNADALQESQRLAPLWGLFADLGGSLRVIAAIAEHLGMVAYRSLPLPIQGLSLPQRARVAKVIDDLALDH